MTWFKVDDGLHSHPKWLAASPAARALWVTAGSWCAAHLTDGMVPRHVIATLVAKPRDAAELVRLGLWKEVENGWEFHGWGEYQPTAESVLTERAAARERQRKARSSRRESRRDIQRDTTRDIQRESPVSHSVSHGYPDPTRPIDNPLASSSDSRGPVDNPPAAGLIDQALELAARRYGEHRMTNGDGKSVDGLARWWTQENADGARLRAVTLLEDHDLTAPQLADALLQPNARWLHAYRRQETP